MFLNCIFRKCVIGSLFLFGFVCFGFFVLDFLFWFLVNLISLNDNPVANKYRDEYDASTG